MRSISKSVLLSALFVIAFQPHLRGIDVEWSQRAWTYSGYTNFVIADLSDGTNYNYQDGNIEIPGIDHGGMAPIFLSPVTNLHPKITDYVSFLDAKLAAPYAASGWQVQYFDPTESPPGKAPWNSMITGIGTGSPITSFGSMKIGITGNNSGVIASNFCYMRYLSNGFHPRITSDTNMFLFFYSKHDSPSPADGGKFRYSIMLKQSAGGSWEKRWDVSNFSFPSKNWTFNTSVFNIPSLPSQLSHATYNPLGIIDNTTVMIPHFNVCDYLEHSTASAINLVSNTVWLNNVILAVDIKPTGYLLSAPIATPQYYLSGGTMYKCTNLKGIYIGGINSITNSVQGVSNALLNNTGNLNLYRGSGVKVDVYLRSGESVAGLFTNRWTGINNWEDTAGIPFTNITKALGDYNPQNAIQSGRIGSNAQYYQYKVRLSTALQGVTAILTNVSLVFDNSVNTGIAPQTPVLISSNSSGSRLTLTLMNFYDPINTRILARNRQTGQMVRLTIIDMTVANYNAARTVTADIALPFGNYDLVISNNSNPNIIVWQKAIMGGLPEGEPIDLITMRRAYKPDVNGRVSLTVSLNIAGSRNMDFEVYDSSGVLVHRTSGSGLPGENTIVWSPRGSRIPLGIYVYQVRISSDSGTVLSKRGMFVLAK